MKPMKRSTILVGTIAVLIVLYIYDETRVREDGHTPGVHCPEGTRATDHQITPTGVHLTTCTRSNDELG